MRNVIVLLAVLPTFAWSAAPGVASGWKMETIDNPSGYGSLVALHVDSATTIKDETGASDVTPRLEFRCSPGDAVITARIDWQRFISSFSTEVGFKVDGGRFTWLKWKVDSTEQVTLSPSAADTQKLIDALTGGSDLLVEVSPYSQGPENAKFDLSGFSDSLENLLNECR